jgi:spore coat polysaccharide biosynthesis predicted glycosyltransferase SpsG
MPEGLSPGREAAWISGVLGEAGARLLVCSLLGRDDAYYGGLRGKGATLLAIFDDAPQRPVPADVVVNFSILQDESSYRRYEGSGTRYCIGPRFMPMREEFHERWRHPRKIPGQVGSIFVNQGGSDPLGLTARILRGLELLDLSQEIVVVVGSAVQDSHRKELKSLGEEAHNSYSFAWGVSPREMGEIMGGSDLAITAAGNTLYELAVCGVPSLIVCHHERHLAVAQRFAELGAAVNLGIGSLLAGEEIARAAQALLDAPEERQALSERMKGIVDGLGCQRIADVVSSVW